MNQAKRTSRKLDISRKGGYAPDVPEVGGRTKGGLAAACGSWARPYSRPPIGPEQRKIARAISRKRIKPVILPGRKPAEAKPPVSTLDKLIQAMKK